MCATNKGVTTCAVAIWFGAHVAAQTNWGIGNGAGSISGSPYHVRLGNLNAATDDVSLGAMDNQMQASAITYIPNGSIVIVKDVVPNTALDFNFNINNVGTISQNFLLDDDSDATLPNSQSFSVPPGTWYVSELNVPSTYGLGISCVDPTNNSSVSGSQATIALASGETVTCTFTNTLLTGTLTLVKVVDNLGESGSAYKSISDFPLTIDEIATTSGAAVTILAGNHTIAETVMTGYDVGTWSCTDGTSGTAGVISATVNVSAGENVTCTMTNTLIAAPAMTVGRARRPLNCRHPDL